MSYATEDIIGALKAAREAKGLTQRALSARTGVPQSHISKIENGGTDIRLSSLIELARALDLDLKLVPRKAAAAVDTVVRSTSPALSQSTRADTARAFREIERTLAAVNRAAALHPDIAALASLQDDLRSLNNLQSAGHEANDAFADLRQAAALARKQLEPLRKTAEDGEPAQDTLRAIAETAARFQQLRNRIARGIPPAALPRPAYRLDDEEEDAIG